uniref:Uncharacterized protein n=1 Tax=Avena sativa TaxID=4498 RepID=A0ACD6A4Y1_AVESA
MAVGVAESHQDRSYGGGGGKVTAFVVLSCITAGMGGAIFGYDIGIAGGVSSMEPFLRKFFPEVYRRMKGDSRVSNYCKFDSQLLTAFTSSLYVAGLFTTFLASRVTSRRGRRPSMILGGAAFLAGAAIGGASVNIYMVILGRVLLGVGLGFANTAVPLYLSEMAPSRHRGAFSNGFHASAANGGLQMLLTQRRYRPQLVMAVAIPFFQQVTGINAIAFYAPVLLRTIGMGESASLLSSVVTGVVGAAATLLSMFLVDRFGRRTLFLAGGTQMLASQVLIGGILAAKLGDDGSVSKAWAGVVIFLIAVYVAGFGWSWGPLGWLVPSEIFPLEVRSAGQGVTVATSFVFTVFVAQAFLAMLCHMRAGIFFFFAAWLAAMTAFVYLFLPETKGVPIEQVDKVWREHWFWKRVVAEEEPASGKL